ncbi:MAG: hypothetical protein H6710_12060 [Myxococcales bacterium]|nr:hypothetical protein [Myxococcales bacterium]MCB9700369.1 hypothetical protein [Myxococcales bacterium]
MGTCVLGEAEATNARFLTNHVWLERLPNDDRDMITHLLVLDTRDGRFGTVGRSSAWRHVIEVFKWFREEDRLTLDFPQERVRTEFTVRTWECAGEAPRPFELCLEMTRGHRSIHFYSRHDWVVEPHGDLAEGEASLAALIAENPELRGLDGVLAPIDADALAAAPSSEDEAAIGVLADEG